MSKLSDLIEKHLDKQSTSARAFAERVGLSYPTLLSLLNNGHVPRKPEHRESLRVALGVDHDAWAQILASSKDGLDLPSDGRYSLQQLVVKALYSQGFSEQSFARATGIPYPTILGITNKGAIPRQDTLEAIAAALSLEAGEVAQAVEISKTQRRAETRPIEKDRPRGTLKEVVTDVAERNGLSLAAFAREHEMPYLALMKLLDAGVAPSKEVMEQLSKALAGSMGGAELPTPIAVLDASALEHKSANGKISADLLDAIGKLNDRQQAALQQFISTLV